MRCVGIMKPSGLARSIPGHVIRLSFTRKRIRSVVYRKIHKAFFPSARFLQFSIPTVDTHAIVEVGADREFRSVRLDIDDVIFGVDPVPVVVEGHLASLPVQQYLNICTYNPINQLLRQKFQQPTCFLMYSNRDLPFSQMAPELSQSLGASVIDSVSFIFRIA